MHTKLGYVCYRIINGKKKVEMFEFRFLYLIIGMKSICEFHSTDLWKPVVFINIECKSDQNVVTFSNDLRQPNI